MKDIVLYSVGLVCASVCSNKSVEETLAYVNSTNPTGISSKWQVSDDVTFAGGEPNPSPCPDSPDTHKHYLLNC